MMTLPDEITTGQKYFPAMEITDPEEAAAYFEACIEHNMRVSEHSRAEAEAIERENLGYCMSRYGTEEQRTRWEDWFGCTCPIFGSVRRPKPTAEEAYRLGYEMGQAMRAGSE